MAKPIDPRAEIGLVRLKVSDLERAITFYEGTLGFAAIRRVGRSAALLSAGGHHPHIWLVAPEHQPSASPLPDVSDAGIDRFSIRYPDRSSLGDALRRLREADVAIDGAGTDGISEALYVRDPDGHALELYWDKPPADWPKDADGTLKIVRTALDPDALLLGLPGEPSREPSPYALMDDANRARLRDLRGKLLQLHKVLLDDARVAYEMDRGRVPSNATLLQLVISDPWFAWLHALSELVVRIDQTVDPDSPATDADAAALIGEVEKLLTASENGEGFHRRYFDALQRQPAVVLAHADVRRAIKAMR